MIVYNNFEWDVREAAACLATRGVTFKEASTVLAGDDVAISEDPTSGDLRAIGLSSRGRMLVVLHRRGPRIRILGAALHTDRLDEVVAPEPVATEAIVAKVVAPEPVATEAIAAKVVAPEPVATEAIAEVATSDGTPPRSGWTTETYGVYWEAYSAARQAARQQGKSPGEAQRLGRKAGERAVLGRAAPSPKASARSGTWLAAARAVKLVG